MASFQDKVRAEGPHPLAESHFEQMNSINPPSLSSLKTPIVWKEDIYALGRDHSGDGKLVKYSISNNEWSIFSVHSSIYTSQSILTTYCSKLLLISGENMTVWEFCSNDFVFKRSCIKPVPSLANQQYFEFMATSKDEYLIVLYKRYCRPSRLSVSIYDGRDWNSNQYKFLAYSGFHSAFHYDLAINSHTIIVIAFSGWDNEVRVLKAPILSLYCDEDVSVSRAHGKELEMISFAEFDKLICTHGTGGHFSILHNQQLYFADSQGIIFTSFIQPPVVPLVWGKSGIAFQQAPHMVGLCDGTMLIIGSVGCQHGSQLDVIKVTQKESEYNPDGNLTMKALVTLEWRMNIPVLSKLHSRLSDLKEKIKLTNACDKPLHQLPRRWHNADTTQLFDVINCIERWIKSTDCVRPTWGNFFRILKDTSPELCELAYQIKVLFHATEAVEDTSMLKADLVHLQSCSNSAEEMARELESSITLCESILQKVQKADAERKQLETQLQSKANEVAELKKQLNLFKQAEENNKTRKLIEKDLPSLLSQLKKHAAAKWKEIGIHLGFLPGELANIEATPNLLQSAPVSWFAVMLESWLQWAPEDSRGSIGFATLEDLKDALSEAGLGASACDLRLKALAAS